MKYTLYICITKQKQKDMKTIHELLTELNACEDARQWASDKTLETIISDCHRGDWLLWLAQKVDIDIRLLTLAKARCAKTVYHLMNDDRSRKAVDVAERFGLGLATKEELAYAAAAAYAVDADYIVDAAYAASYAAYAASYAAYAVDADYIVDAASAAYADSAASYASYAASAAYAAYAASAAAYSDAKSENLKLTADICRDVFANELLSKINKLLTK